MPETRLSQGMIHYDIYGEGQALIGLHDGAGSSRAWKKQVEAFATSYSFVIYDRLGFGRSEHRPSYEEGYFENRVSELGELVRDLGLDSVHLCGMCEGGAIALAFASSFPEKVKTLILQSVGYHGTDQTIARCDEYFQPWSKLDGSLQNWLIYHHGEDYAMLKWEAIRQARHYVWSRSYDLRPRFSYIQAPALIIGGDRDPFFDLEDPIAAYRGIKNSELCIIPGVGHFPNDESPDMFNEVVFNFLKKHSTSPWPGESLS
jgi:pimeloyl-ACP methyl ester carboxylesterase